MEACSSCSNWKELNNITENWVTLVLNVTCALDLINYKN